MTEEQWIERFTYRMEHDTPEQLVAGLAELVLRKDSFQNHQLYRKIFAVIAGKLYLKLLRESQ
jgi:hypothetical protein